jgi:outer membrane protein assembly factor BamB
MLALPRGRAAIAIVALVSLGGCRRPTDIAWSFATPRPWVLAGDSQALTPAIEGDLVFFCGGYEEKGASQLYALELQTGRPKWQFSAGSCGSPPLISGGTVIAFTLAGHGDRIVVFGLDKDSGRQKWKVELPGNPHPPAPAVAGDFVFFAPGSRSVLRIDGRDGSVQSFDIDADLTVAADNLWVAGAPGAAIFGYGKSYWRSRIDSDALDPGPALREPAGRPTGVASDGRILLFGDDDGNLRAIDLGKGSVIWRHHWNKILSAPLVADGKVFVNVYDKKYALTALTLTSGTELWHIEEGSTYAPSWKDGRLYAASGARVLVLEGASGKIQARFAAQTEVTTTPIAGGDVILFGTVRGVLYAARGR